MPLAQPQFPDLKIRHVKSLPPGAARKAGQCLQGTGPGGASTGFRVLCMLLNSPAQPSSDFYSWCPAKCHNFYTAS